MNELCTWVASREVGLGTNCLNACNLVPGSYYTNSIYSADCTGKFVCGELFLKFSINYQLPLRLRDTCTNVNANLKLIGRKVKI